MHRPWSSVELLPRSSALNTFVWTIVVAVALLAPSPAQALRDLRDLRDFRDPEERPHVSLATSSVSALTFPSSRMNAIDAPLFTVAGGINTVTYSVYLDLYGPLYRPAHSHFLHPRYHWGWSPHAIPHVVEFYPAEHWYWSPYVLRRRSLVVVDGFANPYPYPYAPRRLRSTLHSYGSPRLRGISTYADSSEPLPQHLRSRSLSRSSRVEDSHVAAVTAKPSQISSAPTPSTSTSLASTSVAVVEAGVKAGNDKPLKAQQPSNAPVAQSAESKTESPSNSPNTQGSASVDRNDFLEDFPDVPIIPGMEEVKHNRVSFENDNGRFVQTMLIGKPSLEVLAFLDETMPALGWTSEGRDSSAIRFVREGELLVFQFIIRDQPNSDALPSKDQDALVLITLTPL